MTASAMRKEMRMAKVIAARGGYGRNDAANANTESWAWYAATSKAISDSPFLTRNTIDLTTAESGAHWLCDGEVLAPSQTHLFSVSNCRARGSRRVRFVPGRMP